MIPWDQTPGFLAATNTTIVPGGPTAYGEISYLGHMLSSLADQIIALPRQAGNSAGDVTAFHPGHVSWSKHNMPDILYILRPSDEWYAFTAAPLPPQKLSGGQFMFVGPNGNVVLSNNRNAREDHQRLLDFKILPDKVRFLFNQSENFPNPSWVVRSALVRSGGFSKQCVGWIHDSVGRISSCAWNL